MPTYGSTAAAEGFAHNDPTPNDMIPTTDDHSDSLTIMQCTVTHFTQEIDRHWSDLVLLVSYVATGLLDSSAVYIWGSFVSMQTGNTVYLGLGLAAPTQSKRWVKSLTSLACFCLGSFCFSRYHRYFHPKRRWVLVLSFAMQSVLVFLSAVIVMTETPTEDPPELRWEVLIPIALVAFQSSAQAQISRALGFKSLTSVVLTSIYCDLFADPDLFAPIAANDERNHRMAAPLLLLTGAFLGGKLSHSSVGLAGALLMASVLKILIAVAFVLWRAEPESVPSPQPATEVRTKCE